MKYLKLFEAFQSKKLSKTLTFIKDKVSKDIFIKQIDQICKLLDFPNSELSDDYFQYLPFKKALELNIDPSSDKSKCTRKSEVEFGENGIPGEICQGGKLMRKWGRGRRMVECPRCNGTGIDKSKSEVKWIKFWFDEKGHWIFTTVTDSIQQDLSNRRASQIPSGAISPAYRWNRGLSVTKGSNPGVSTSLFNKLLIYRSELRPYDQHLIVELLSNAQFALVLDYEKLKNEEYQKLTDIQTKRSEFKSLMMTDEEIKQQNIKRYLDEISNRTKIPHELKDLGKVMNRVMGSKYLGLYLLNHTESSILGHIISRLGRSFKARLTDENYSVENDYEGKGALESIQNSMKRNTNRNIIITQSISEVKKELKIQSMDQYLPVIDKLMELNQVSIDKFNNFEYENLEDLEVIRQKAESIYRFVRSTEENIIIERIIDKLMEGPDQKGRVLYHLLQKPTSSFNSTIDSMKNFIRKI